MDNLDYELSGQNASRNRGQNFVIEVKPQEPQNQDAAVKFSVDIVLAREIYERLLSKGWRKIEKNWN